MPIERLKELLDRNGVKYTVISHALTYTAAGTAALTHIPGNEIAKTVMVRLDGELAMAVIPGTRHLDLGALKKAAGAKEIALLSEDQFASIFPDCEVGAMPPFGVLYGLPVYIEEQLTKDLEIAFNAGSHRELIRLAYKDYERIEHPMVMRIGTRSAAEILEEKRVNAIL